MMLHDDRQGGEGYRVWPEWLLCGLSIAICFYFFTSFLFSVWVNAWPGPFNDYWVEMPLIQQLYAGQLKWQDLLVAHNNVHRIFIPRLLFLLDYHFFSGSNVLLLWVSLLCKLFFVVLFNAFIYHYRDQALQSSLLKRSSLTYYLLINTLVFAGVFHAHNVHNIIYNFNIQWDLVAVFALFSILMFYRLLIDAGNSMLSIIGWLSGFLLAMLSQGGALALIPVYFFMALIERRVWWVVVGFLLSVLLAYGLIYALPVSNPENAILGDGVRTLLLFPHVVIGFFLKMLTVALLHYMGNIAYLFSVLLCILLLLSLWRIKKTQGVNLFLYMTLYFGVNLINIAAARVIFSANHWWASRFESTIILFLVSLLLHVCINHRQVFFWGKTRKDGFMHECWLFPGLGLLVLSMAQYYAYKDAFNLSNKVFQSHALIFYTERNQKHAAGLVTFFNERDRVAGIDPTFVEHDLAYYANKQSKNSLVPEVKRLGEKLVLPVAQESVNQGSVCRYQVRSDIETRYNAGLERYYVYAPLRLSWFDFWSVLKQRNSYYLLDEQQHVVGFGFLQVPISAHRQGLTLEGLVNQNGFKYVADVDTQGQVRCLLQVDPV